MDKIKVNVGIHLYKSLFYYYLKLFHAELQYT